MRSYQDTLRSQIPEIALLTADVRTMEDDQDERETVENRERTPVVEEETVRKVLYEIFSEIPAFRTGRRPPGPEGILRDGTTPSTSAHTEPGARGEQKG